MGGIKWESRKEWRRLGEQRVRGDRVAEHLTSHSHTHTHTLHSLRKWLAHLSKSPTGTQGGARGLLQQLHFKLTQPLHPLVLGDPPRDRPHLQTDTESSPLRKTHNTTLSHCVSCKNTYHCDGANHIRDLPFAD